MKIKKLDIKDIFYITLLAATLIYLGTIAFSVRIYIDFVIFFILALLLVINFVYDIKKDPKKIKEGLKRTFSTAKWLYIAIIIYILCDIIICFYSPGFGLFYRKFVRMGQYGTLFLSGVYLVKTKKQQIDLISIIAITGTLISIGAYLVHFFSVRPIYFHRISSAKDYNVFAALVFFCYLFGFYYLLKCSNRSFIKRLLLFIVYSVINIPVIYYAGSRRLIVIFPLFLILYLVSETALFIFRQQKIRMFKTGLCFFGAAVVMFGVVFTCRNYFTMYGEYKIDKYMERQSDLTERPKDATLEQIEDTIINNTALNKRKIIWRVAIDEIKSYNVPQIVFGKGQSYNIYFYNIVDDSEYIQAYSIAERGRPEGMHAHNFILADMLDGGIFKLSAGFFLVLMLLLYILKLFKTKNNLSILFFIVISFVMFNKFISGEFGILSDLFFWTAVMTLCVTLKLPLENNTVLVQKED